MEILTQSIHSFADLTVDGVIHKEFPAPHKETKKEDQKYDLYLLILFLSMHNKEDSKENQLPVYI